MVGDILDSAICPGPFDVIIERSTARGYYDRGIAAVLAALERRLSQDGIFFSHCHDGGWSPLVGSMTYLESAACRRQGAFLGFPALTPCWRVYYCEPVLTDSRR